VNVPFWVAELAAAFWDSAGGPEPFPRTLRGPMRRSGFDLTIKELPDLTVRGVERYLAGLGAGGSCGEPDRPLRACLVAVDGGGFIFLDPADAPDERVFSLAHELAHFLRDYWQPRRLACRRLGAGITEVFDGKRPPTPVERVRALLAGVPVGVHAHLMERGPYRERLPPEVALAEDEADRLAYELLAPAGAVRVRTGAGAGDRARVAEVLRQDFGLAPARAGDYVRLLLPLDPADPLLRRLGQETAG
jgi:hypothetical protein